MTTTQSHLVILSSLAALLATLSLGPVNADTLVGYAPTGTSVNGPLAPSTVDTPVVTATDLTRGPGTAGYDNAGGNTDFFGAFYSIAFNNPNMAAQQDGTLADAVSNGIYLTFSITAGSTGARITGLNLSNDFFFQNSNNYTIEDSLTGFGSSSSDVLATVDYANKRFSAGPTLTFGTLEKLMPGATDTFRIYVDSLQTYTDFGIGDGGSTPANSHPFAVIGVAAPEPSSYALLGLGVAALIVAMRNRRSSVA